jgi:3'(2'), 5'-bisphosphate nucleotidase
MGLKAAAMRLDRPDDRRRLLDGLDQAALAAGAEINSIFEAGFAIETKADASPVTAADRAGEAAILHALAILAPGIPVVAEEEVSEGRIPAVTDCFFLVDALDGTREFVKRGSDFTVNIGLIEDGTPTMGVVYAPRQHRMFAGDALLRDAWRRDGDVGERIALRIRPGHKPPTAVASRSHITPELSAYLNDIEAGERVNIGSSLKFALLANGEADVYPRPSPTMEWDTAAGHAVLLAAGGKVFGIDGAPLAYAKPDFFNPGFVAVGDYDPPAIGPYMGNT